MSGEEWYLPTHDESSSLYVLEMGKGPTYVILHGGWGNEHSYLLDAFEGLEKDYRLVFYDQRGSLRSPAKLEMVSAQAHVDDLERLRKELGLDRLNLIGHSVGSLLALLYLQKYPKNVGNLILSALLPIRNSETQTPEEVEFSEGHRERVDHWNAKQVELINRPDVIEQLKNEGLEKESLSAKEATRAWRIKFAGVSLFYADRWRQMKGGRAFFNGEVNRASFATTPKRWDFTELLRNHDAPITGIIGDHDFTDMGAKFAHHWLDPIENVKLIVVRDAGHSLWIDQPTEFRKVLSEAMKNAV